MFNPAQPSAGNTQSRNVRPLLPHSPLDQFTSTHPQGAIHDSEKIRQFLMNRFRNLQQHHSGGEALSVFVNDVDYFLEALEHHRGSPVRGMRFATRKEAFGLAIASAGNKPFELVQHYLEIPHFKGKNHLVIEYAREKIEQTVRARYRLPAGAQHPSLVRRITAQQLQRISQGDYILHVCGLFNLEKKIHHAEWTDFTAQLDDASRNTLRGTRQPDQWVGKKYKDAISELIGIFSGQQGRGLHNIHPASRLLESCSGFVFHPNRNNQAQDLINSESPLSFEQIGRTLALKYLESVQSNQLDAFFEEAFQRTDPCYEATVENILAFQPTENRIVIFHPKPKWIDSASAEDNIDGLLVWAERELLRDYSIKKISTYTHIHSKKLTILFHPRTFRSFLVIIKHWLINDYFTSSSLAMTSFSKTY
ncbi:hypothetical protein [Actimicrobium antarcticum]|uniref:hypothetical protein n=1 Tax=Actimicrobium antarcticum TaxID=1051899 RepID=UPI0031CF28D0